MAAIPQLDVGQNDQLSHHGHDGDLVLLAVGYRLVERCREVRVPASRGLRGHVHGITRSPSAAVSVALCVRFSAVLGTRRDTRQAGGVAIPRASEFRHPPEEHQSVPRAVQLPRLSIDLLAALPCLLKAQLHAALAHPFHVGATYSSPRLGQSDRSMRQRIASSAPSAPRKKEEGTR